MAFDSMMNSVNRMFEICDLEIEKVEAAGELEMKNWPKLGQIVYSNVTMRYRENTPLVLKGMNFKIKDKEKVGIVGRTGAGKSSVISTLFRFNSI